MIKHTKKSTNNITPMRKPVVKNTNTQQCNQKSCAVAWSASIYVYWFIILFFIAATFYILGRSHTTTTNIAPSEEALMQASDYYESGKTKLAISDLSGAISDFNTAIESGGASITTYLLRGEAYMQLGEHQNALKDFNTAIEKDATNSIAYYDRALLNIRAEDYEAALADINKALALSAKEENSLLQQRDLYAKRGQLNLWLKNLEGAVSDYTNSLARPDGTIDPAVYAERAEAYTALGNYDLAINDYSAAVRIISEQIQGATTSQEREKMSTDAMDYFEKSAALNVKINNINNAISDLSAARQIAIALNNEETTERLDNLLLQLKQ